MVQCGLQVQFAIVGQVDGHVAGRAMLNGSGQCWAETDTGSAALAFAKGAAALPELAAQLPSQGCSHKKA
ncbi:hypothetical protein AS19_26620 [Alcanivorax sp. NBRC 101098]|jgi:hypothetical protein|nr:hypothetical protein AS19_26620 [Alcanivorax sp. NBRC 101098]